MYFQLKMGKFLCYENRPWKRRFLFKTIIFRCELLVSGRVIHPVDLPCWNHHPLVLLLFRFPFFQAQKKLLVRVRTPLCMRTVRATQGPKIILISWDGEPGTQVVYYPVLWGLYMPWDNYHGTLQPCQLGLCFLSLRKNMCWIVYTMSWGKFLVLKPP